MMDWEDVRVQLIDTPPITADYLESYLSSMVRSADLCVLVLDLSDDDGPFTAEAVVDKLAHVKTVLVGEPPALLGDDSAPNPSETALAALGSCISVGMLANATHRGVTLTKIEVEMEGDIDISAVWGVGDTPDGKLLGFSAVRCKVALAGDTDDKTLKQIHDNAIAWSPVVNSFRRPVTVDSTLVVG